MAGVAMSVWTPELEILISKGHYVDAATLQILRGCGSDDLTVRFKNTDRGRMGVNLVRFLLHAEPN
jgi:hypothetical protein